MMLILILYNDITLYFFPKLKLRFLRFIINTTLEVSLVIHTDC